MQIQQFAEGIFTIDNFLTQEECEELITRSESLGYKPADVDVHGQRQMLSMIRTMSGLIWNLWHWLRKCGKNLKPSISLRLRVISQSE